MRAAVKRNGLALQYASYELRADKELVLAAVAQDGDLLRYASENLQADKQVVRVSELSLEAGYFVYIHHLRPPLHTSQHALVQKRAHFEIICNAHLTHKHDTEDHPPPLLLIITQRGQ